MPLPYPHRATFLASTLVVPLEHAGMTAFLSRLLSLEVFDHFLRHPIVTLGVAGRSRDFSISGTARLDLLDLLVAQAAKQGRRFSPDSRPEAGSFYRSDHFPFAKVGVPAISFDSGEDLVNGGLARGEALARDYIDKRYHQPDDEFASTWDYSGMSDDAALLHTVGRDLANSAAWPDWSADSEFRAVRDRTAAERGVAAPPPDAGVVRSGERG